MSRSAFIGQTLRKALGASASPVEKVARSGSTDVINEFTSFAQRLTRSGDPALRDLGHEQLVAIRRLRREEAGR